MKEAARIYSTNKPKRGSATFKSVVNRAEFLSPLKGVPGPGQYQLSAPLVKPKIQAIYKQNRSILIQIHDAKSPAFHTAQPRFKEIKTQSPTSTQFEKNFAERDAFLLKLKQRKKSYLMAKKRNRMTVLIPEPESSINQDIKTPFWSKYQEKNKESLSSYCAPGPGSYSCEHSQFKYHVHENSWQFRSGTNRAFPHIKKRPQDATLKRSNERMTAIHSRYNLIQ